MARTITAKTTDNGPIAPDGTDLTIAPDYVAGAPDEIVAESPDGWEWETVVEESAVGVKMEIGDEFVGQYKGPELITPEGMDRDGEKLKPFNIYVFRGRNGVRYSFGELYYLVKALESVKIDEWCRIKRMDDVETGLNPMQNFRVDVRRR